MQTKILGLEQPGLNTSVKWYSATYDWSKGKEITETACVSGCYYIKRNIHNARVMQINYINYISLWIL